MIRMGTLSSSLLSSKNLAWIAICNRLCMAGDRDEYNHLYFRLQTVPEDVYEAGAIDGATGWNKFKT